MKIRRKRINIFETTFGLLGFLAPTMLFILIYKINGLPEEAAHAGLGLFLLSILTLGAGAMLGEKIDKLIR